MGSRGTGWVTVTENAYFTNFILFAILWSSIMLAMESPAYPAEGSKAEEAFFGIDVAFTVVFTVEMGIQWAALGLGGYFAATANQLDFIIVFTAWLSLILELSGVDAGTSPRCVRCACCASFARCAPCDGCPRCAWSWTAR